MNYCELKTTCREGVYREKVLIDRQYALGDVARLMQRITEKAMSELGISYSRLEEKHLIWVMCFMEIRINRMPSDGEMLEIYTWPGKERFGMYSRRMVMYSPEGGECLIESTVLSSAVDRDTRKMITPAASEISFPIVEFADEPAFPKLYEKGIRTPLTQQHEVSIHEIDINEHVNNSFYLDWAENLLGDHSDRMHENAKRIWINYEREILAGETVVFHYGIEKGTLFVKGRVGDDNCFKALLSA
jgi:acyl-ACP thioesterase